MELAKTNYERFNERVHRGEEGMARNNYDFEKLSILEKKLLISFIDEYNERYKKK